MTVIIASTRLTVLLNKFLLDTIKKNDDSLKLLTLKRFPRGKIKKNENLNFSKH